VPIARRVEEISPELALVDDELDSTARRALPDATDCLAPPPPVGLCPVAAGPRRRGFPALRFAGIAVVLAAAATGFLATGHDSERQAVAGTSIRAHEARAGISAPDAQAPARKPAGRGFVVGNASGRPGSGQADGAVRLRWRSVPGAVFYNVILWRGSSRVRDLWPARAVVDVRRASLAPGKYRWFVYPALGTGTGRRYGALVAQGVVKV